MLLFLVQEERWANGIIEPEPRHVNCYFLLPPLGKAKTHRRVQITGRSKLPIWGDSNRCKSLVILKDFPENNNGCAWSLGWCHVITPCSITTLHWWPLRQYLAELSEHRDRVRCETLSAPMQVWKFGLIPTHAKLKDNFSWLVNVPPPDVPPPEISA